MLRYPTLDATTSSCIVSNRCSRNGSTPNLKISFGVSLLTHRLVSLRSRIRPQGAGVGPLINVTGERERIPSRHVDGLKEVAVFQTVGVYNVYL